ncbi:helix-turn-helix transcriptional regulator [Enterovibrio nigricans]|uniref:AraC-type DNA-binding protein n=1 Tax=Enterovibrio nigricans DSM 22720 TaxID=1121868 RepID=A0A1T4W6V0_9GAMM|nr:AraC family transcriptional regulator [Enterovibrio nigricans]SKA72829.1 AraC-type DNA-binding protein [Enterovibrio nigricans DSM 22720]
MSTESVAIHHMMLIGPNPPHAVTSQDVKIQQCETHIVWFREVWIKQLMASCEELKDLSALLERANLCIEFSEQTAEKVFQLLNDCTKTSPIDQLAVLLQVLSVLRQDSNSKTLLPTSSGKTKIDDVDRAKIEKICDYLARNMAEPITLSDLGRVFHASGSSIQRLFTDHFGESFSSYLKKLRLGHACSELQATTKPIALIAENVGYRNLSNFNRQFKQYKQLTPREYRGQYQLKRGI